VEFGLVDDTVVFFVLLEDLLILDVPYVYEAFVTGNQALGYRRELETADPVLVFIKLGIEAAVNRRP
jgi:hypothetical protein